MERHIFEEEPRAEAMSVQVPTEGCRLDPRVAPFEGKSSVVVTSKDLPLRLEREEKVVGVQKFYVVRRGYTPGIYRSWPECQRQVLYYPGAEY